MFIDISFEIAENVLRRLKVKAKICIFVSILVIGFVFFSCSTNKSVTETGVNVTATGTSEGLVLNFKNIPEDTVQINVAIQDVARNDYRNGYFDSAIQFEENELAELMKTKTLICPFVKNGHEYQIVIYFWHNGWDKEEYKGDTRIIINAVAGGGISPLNNPSLSFNDENNALVLSVKPEFPKEVVYSQNSTSFFYFCIGMENDLEKGNDRIYYGSFFSDTDELICDISDIYNKSNETKNELGLLNEDLIIAGFMGCNLNYGNSQWMVGITETDEVIVSL